MSMSSRFIYGYGFNSDCDKERLINFNLRCSFCRKGEAVIVNDKVLREIKEYVENNAKDFDLDGVEFCDEDFDFVEELIAKGKSLEDACDEMMQGVSDCLGW